MRIPQHNEWSHTPSGYFNNPNGLSEAIGVRDGQADIHVTTDPINPVPLARTAKRIITKSTSSAAHANTISRRFPFIGDRACWDYTARIYRRIIDLPSGRQKKAKP